LTRPHSWDGKALDLVAQGKYQDALQIANQKLASHPKSQDDVSSAYLIQNDAYTGMGKTEKAIQDLEKGLDIFREKHCFPPKKIRAHEVDPLCTADARELHRQMESLNLKR
jgi:tetratricopeptide (TPR) repeat protein